jgi:hypothetical protein
MRTSASLDNQQSITITQELRQGYVSESNQGTLIASQTRSGITSTTWTTSAYNLTAAEAGAITDYSNLYFRFHSNSRRNVAFTYLRDIVLAVHKTNSSSWSFAPSAALNAGELGILVIAVDNLDATDGDFGCYPERHGQCWETLGSKAGEFTNGQGSAAAGCDCRHLVYCGLLLPCSTTGSITITLQILL